MDTVYIETSIVSHATAWPSTNIEVAAMQFQAQQWWTQERHKFDLVTSQLVIDEASSGDPGAASDRLNLLEGLPLLPVTDDAAELAKRILSSSLMPKKAAADALHVAVAAVAGIKYLLTLNCRHIANAHTLPRVYRLLHGVGYGQLLICTPAEFLGEYCDEESDS